MAKSNFLGIGLGRWSLERVSYKVHTVGVGNFGVMGYLQPHKYWTEWNHKENW